MATIQGMRSTANVTQDVRMRDLQKDIVWLQPNRAPFYTLLARLGSKPSVNMKFEHAEYDVVPPQVTLTNASQASNILLLPLTTTDMAARCKVNMQLFNPATYEQMRITAINFSTATLTVTRGEGGTTAATIAASQVLVLASEGNEEGANYGPAISNEVSVNYNYLQEFETAIQASNIQQTMVDYINPDWPEQVKRGAITHKEKMERAIFLGRLNFVPNGPNGNPVWFTGGLLHYTRDNAYTDKNGNSNYFDNGGSIVTESSVMNWLRPLSVYGDPTKKVIITSPLGWDMISRLSKGYQRVDRSEKTIGMTINKVELNGKIYTVIESLAFTQWNMDDMLACVDLSCVRLRTFSGNGKNWAPKWIQNVQANDSKSQKDVIYSIQGLQIMNTRAHGFFRNFSL